MVFHTNTQLNLRKMNYTEENKISLARNASQNSSHLTKNQTSEPCLITKLVTQHLSYKKKIIVHYHQSPVLNHADPRNHAQT